MLRQTICNPFPGAIMPAAWSIRSRTGVWAARALSNGLCASGFCDASEPCVVGDRTDVEPRHGLAYGRDAVLLKEYGCRRTLDEFLLQRGEQLKSLGAVGLLGRSRHQVVQRRIHPVISPSRILVFAAVGIIPVLAEILGQRIAIQIVGAGGGQHHLMGSSIGLADDLLRLACQQLSLDSDLRE